MEIKADVRAVGDEDALGGALEALGLNSGKFLEETGDVEDGTGTDQVDTFRRDQTGGQDVEVVGNIIVDDGVAGICSIEKERLGQFTTWWPRSGSLSSGAKNLQGE